MQLAVIASILCVIGVSGQSPVFLSAYPTSYNVPDTLGTSQSVALLVISDSDAVTLSMSTNTYFQFADNGDKTGTVSSSSSTALTGGSGTTQTLTFVALDAASNTNSTSYSITITNTSPTLLGLPTTAPLAEDVPLEILVYTINCTDPSDSVSSSLVSVSPSNSPSSEFFFVQLIPSSTNYGVYARSQSDTSQGTFNYNTQTSYVVQVQCTDGKDSVTGSLTVNLVRNEQPIIINLSYPTSVSVASSTAASQTVYTVVATDNENDTVTFNFVCNPSGCPFTVSSVNTSTAIVQTTLDLSTLTSTSDLGYDITITPADAKNSGESRILTILITGTNNAPTFSNLDNAITVNENTAVGSTLFTVTTADVDMDSVTTSLTSDPASGTSLFEIDSSNNIKVLSALDYEALTNTTYVLTVLATDTKTTSNATFTIVIADVNEALTWNSANYRTNVPDGAATGTIVNITGFAVTDPDGNETLTCHMSCSPSGYFSMSTTCVITVTSVYSLDEGLANTVTCTVNGTDNDNANTATTSLVLDIVDANNYSPVFQESGYTFNISPYENANVALGSVNATDADTGTFGQFTYSLNQTQLSRTFFSIGSTTGIVSTVLSIETCNCSGSTLAVPVYATDTGGRVGTSTVHITLAVTSTTSTTTTTERPKTFTEEASNTSWLAVVIATAGVTAIVTAYVLIKYLFNGSGNICNKWSNKTSWSKPTKSKPTNRNPQEGPAENRPKQHGQSSSNDMSPPKHLQRWRNEKFL